MRWCKCEIQRTLGQIPIDSRDLAYTSTKEDLRPDVCDDAINIRSGLEESKLLAEYYFTTSLISGLCPKDVDAVT